MDDIIPGLGLGAYADKLRSLAAFAPPQLALIEDAMIFGLGAAAALLVLVALVRGSAVAVVSFSFLALASLVVAILFARLTFVPIGTQVLIVCLFACAILLFMTATVRLARENPIVGGVTLILIVGLLGLGGASAAGLYSNPAVTLLVLASAGAVALVFLLADLVRGDRPTLAVAPGLLLMILSPLGMAYVGHMASGGSWLLVLAPAAAFAIGALYAAFSAQFVAGILSGAQAVERPGRHGHIPVVGGAMLREVEDHEVGAPMAPRFDDDADTVPSHRQRFTPPVQEPALFDPPPEPAAEPVFDEPPLPTPAPAAPPEPAYSDSEPVSAQWGAGKDDFSQMAWRVEPDEYVWDMMADQEVKLGGDFADAFGLPGGQLNTPDMLREGVAPQSLSAFDDQILGGCRPATGRFEVTLDTVEGARVQLEGRRQVDSDGLLMRIEARMTSVAPVTVAAAAPLTATGPAPSGGKDSALRALSEGRIEAHFQPIVRFSDRTTVGFEALARWRRLDGTVIEAKDFIDQILAADRGIELARVIVDRAAEELAAWVAAAPGAGQFVSVNVAATDLPKDELGALVRDAVEARDLPPGALVVELTEGRIQASQNRALGAAKALRKAGASLAIDDFGVGYSTLSRLSKFHFDLVKLDQSVVDNLSRDKRQRSFVKAVLANAGKMGAPVIAEGIADEETAATLTDLGCDFGQGYLFGKAEPMGEAVAMLDETPPQQQQAEMRDTEVRDTGVFGADPRPAPRTPGRVGNLR